MSANTASASGPSENDCKRALEASANPDERFFILYILITRF